MEKQNKVLKFLLGLLIIYVTATTTALVCKQVYADEEVEEIVEEIVEEEIEPLVEEEHVVIVHHREVIDTKDITQPYVSLTDDEKYLVATVLKLEGGGESIECQYAIASVIINRYTTSDSTISQIIYAKNQFSVASEIPNAHPTGTQLKIVENVCKYGPTIPEYVIYFRAGNYHEKTGIPYFHLDNTYFSYNKNLFDKYMEKIVSSRESGEE